MGRFMDHPCYDFLLTKGIGRGVFRWRTEANHGFDDSAWRMEHAAPQKEDLAHIDLTKIIKRK